MMLLVEFEKTNSMAYVPHVDILRAVTRTLRRADIKIDYSEGFNPHALLYFSPPLPIGTESICEQFSVYTEEPPESFIKNFNAVSPEGLKVLSCKRYDTKVNPAKSVYRAEYLIQIEADENEAANKIPLALEKIKAEKAGRVIDALYLPPLTIKAVLSVGQDNLRGDRFTDELLTIADLKTESYAVKRIKLFSKE